MKRKLVYVSLIATSLVWNIPSVLANDATSEPIQPIQVVSDPIEPFNRAMFELNDKLYFWVFKPISQGYGYILPQELRVLVKNFFHNLNMPVRVVNNMLQMKPVAAGYEVERFAINTVMGAIGFFDVAELHFGLNHYNEDFGQTLGSYGLGDQVYVVWPVIGPSCLRDTVGLAGDLLLSPTTYLPHDIDSKIAFQGLKYVNNTSLAIGDYEDLIKAALDPYISVRDAYLQSRRDQVKH